MSVPLVSIIIPTFNRAHIIGETLNSILNQTYTNWECILVDDGSTDDTVNFVLTYEDKDSRFRFYKRPLERLKGPSACRNIGLENAVGEYILFLDSDDLLAETCIEKRLEFARKHNDIDFWIFRTKMFKYFPNDKEEIFNKTDPTYDDTYYLNKFLQGGFPYCITGPFWKKKSLQALNGFDEHLTIFEDPDLHIRAYLKQQKSIVSPDINPDNFYRVSEFKNFDISDVKKIKMFDSALLFYSKFYDDYPILIQKNSIQFFKNVIYINSSFLMNMNYYYKFSKKGFFKFKQIVFIPIAIILKKIGFSHIKGLGFYKFIKFTFK